MTIGHVPANGLNFDRGVYKASMILLFLGLTPGITMSLMSIFYERNQLISRTMSDGLGFPFFIGTLISGIVIILSFFLIGYILIKITTKTNEVTCEIYSSVSKTQ